MRYVKLTISLLIGVVGMVVYFVSMPIIDEDKMVELTVEAGDESLLDDLYLSGYLMDYSSFILSEDNVSVYEELPYLERLDTRHYAELAMLQKGYPEFMNELLFNMNTYAFGISTDEEYLVVGSVNQDPESYQAQFNQLTVQVLNKETGEIAEDSIRRENFPTGDSIDFLGIYQEYPKVKFLINTGSWDTQAYEETANISLIEYNMETKDYSEESITKEDGYIYSYGYGVISTNDSLITLALAPNYEDTIIHLFNFENNTFNELGGNQDNFIISEDNQLYSLTHEEGRSLLNHYDEETMDILHQTALGSEETTPFAMGYPDGVSLIADDKLYIAQSQYATGMHTTPDISPSTLYVFDIKTGEQLLQSEIQYDLDKQTAAFEAYIETMGLLSKF